MVRRPALLAAFALCTLASAGCGDDGAAQPARHDPILFVHGYSASAGVWQTALERFRGDGWPARDLIAWSYDSSRSNVVTAREVAAKVAAVRRATGAAKVNLVTRSMGGLSTRWYLKKLGGAAHVDAWVSLGGPNHGTTGLGRCRDVACREMRPGSPFLRALNAGDETPGAVRYATWWSPCDTVIDPDASVRLDGAANTRTGCVSHGALASDEHVYEEVRAFLR